jgi:branched-chain amino acid transport system substrate-binding protein
MSWRAKVATNGALSRRQAIAGGAAALITAPFVIRSSSAQPAAVNIGVIQPLSGANAQFGVNSRNGIELVADEVNAAASRHSAAPESTWSSATRLRTPL